MSASLKGLPPQAIVLASVDAFALESSTAEGMMTFGVNLGDVRDTEDLTQAVATELMFPHEATGLDALLDLMSDLDWFGHDEGYVVQFDHLDELSQREPELLACFVACFRTCVTGGGVAAFPSCSFSDVNRRRGTRFAVQSTQRISRW